MPPSAAPDASADAGSDLTRSYVRVLVLEALVIAALYGFSRYFA
jgi:hypothetical protein